MLSWRRPRYLATYCTRSRPRAPLILADMLKSKKSKTRKGNRMDGYHKRGPDYTDFAYHEAVSKLRYLLAESYAPVSSVSKYPLAHHHHHHHHPHPMVRSCDRSEDEKDKRTLALPTHHPPVLIAPKRPETSVQPPPELMSFIERQEEYIEQLEKESQYCREELSNLMAKVKEVISENEGLHERQKTGLLRSVLDTLEYEDEDEEDGEQEEKGETRPVERTTKRKHLTGPNIVFESRISELEAQLTQTKMDLRKALDEAESLRKKTGDHGAPVSLPSIESRSDSDLYRQIEALQRERDDLNETVAKLQSTVTQLREKEANAVQKVKRSLDTVDQAQFDKNQAELEVRRLKSELERVSEKQRENVAEQSRRVADMERRYAAQTEQLTADLSVQWENATKLSLELDKQRRVEADLRRELAQRNAVIEELKKEFNAKTSSLQSELLSGSSERESLAQEVASLRLAAERSDRNAHQETSRLQAEVTSLRQRLDRADADLLHSRKENLRLTEQIASLEKELHLAKLTSGDNKEGSYNKELKRDKELTSMILDMDAKHVQNVAELEGMIQSQTQLMEKLKDECHTLTQKLEDSSARHKEDKANLREQNEKLLDRLSRLWENCKELRTVCNDKGLAFPYSDNQMIQWWETMNNHSTMSSPLLENLKKDEEAVYVTLQDLQCSSDLDVDILQLYQ